MWLLHIGRGRSAEDIEVHEFDEKPERSQNGKEVEWFGVSCGEEVLIRYSTDEVIFAFAAPAAEENLSA